MLNRKLMTAIAVVTITASLAATVPTVTASPSQTQSGRHESFPSFRSIDIILALLGLDLGLTNTLFGSFLGRRAGSHQAAFEEEIRQLGLGLIFFNFGHSSTSSRHGDSQRLQAADVQRVNTAPTVVSRGQLIPDGGRVSGRVEIVRTVNRRVDFPDVGGRRSGGSFGAARRSRR